MANPLVLSGSSITTFLRCGRQWYFAYIEGIKSPPNLKQIVGIATHEAVETNMRQKVTTKMDLPTSDVIDAFVTAYDRQVPTVEIIEEGEDVGSSKDSGVAITRLYQTVVAPPIQPLWVEREIQFSIDGQPYSGYIDLVEVREDVFGEQHIIRDTKTTGRKPSGGSYGIAMTGYAIAFREQMGVPESDVVLDYLVRTKTPQYVPISSDGPVTDDTIKQFGSIVRQVASAIDAGSFLPNGIQNNACGWCGYREICTDFKRMNK